MLMSFFYKKLIFTLDIHCKKLRRAFDMNYQFAENTLNSIRWIDGLELFFILLRRT